MLKAAAQAEKVLSPSLKGKKSKGRMSSSSSKDGADKQTLLRLQELQTPSPHASMLPQRNIQFNALAPAVQTTPPPSGKSILREMKTRNRRSRCIPNNQLPNMRTTVKLADENAKSRWVQCDNPKCLKWRRLDPSFHVERLRGKWTCKLNSWDSTRAMCEADEEPVTGERVLTIRDTEKSYDEDKEKFYTKLRRFLESINTPMTRNPTLGGKDLDLYRLYLEVVDRGGCEQVVCIEGTWARIFRSLDNYSSSVTDASYRLKRYYKEYLFAYEQHVHFKKPLNEIEIPSLSSRSRRKKSSTGGGSSSSSIGSKSPAIRPEQPKRKSTSPLEAPVRKSPAISPSLTPSDLLVSDANSAFSLGLALGAMVRERSPMLSSVTGNISKAQQARNRELLHQSIMRAASPASSPQSSSSATSLPTSTHGSYSNGHSSSSSTGPNRMHNGSGSQLHNGKGTTSMPASPIVPPSAPPPPLRNNGFPVTREQLGAAQDLVSLSPKITGKSPYLSAASPKSMTAVSPRFSPLPLHSQRLQEQQMRLLDMQLNMQETQRKLGLSPSPSLSPANALTPLPPALTSMSPALSSVSSSSNKRKVSPSSSPNGVSVLGSPNNDGLKKVAVSRSLSDNKPLSEQSFGGPMSPIRSIMSSCSRLPPSSALSTLAASPSSARRTSTLSASSPLNSSSAMSRPASSPKKSPMGSCSSMSVTVSPLVMSNIVSEVRAEFSALPGAMSDDDGDDAFRVARSIVSHSKKFVYNGDDMHIPMSPLLKD